MESNLLYQCNYLPSFVEDDPVDDINRQSVCWINCFDSTVLKKGKPSTESYVDRLFLFSVYSRRESPPQRAIKKVCIH
ncbi:hypothetical protein F2Q69_00000497 [Brassica cretica]|uniref:Uncharacterized protein n=1 Tax=Brassica cretica TaxID=69181 RepID=A0A8S9NX64_BRACR|nr:hypothetical protein F2Q69_00000497 [Brassica cretica]